MSRKSVNFVETWIADELLCRSPTGESKEQILERFKEEAVRAGIIYEDASTDLEEDTLKEIAKKHSGGL